LTVAFVLGPAVVSRIKRVVSRGASKCGKWPQCSNQCRRASGNKARAFSLTRQADAVAPPQPMTSGRVIAPGGAPR
jgi:hypothetical protein